MSRDGVIAGHTQREGLKMRKSVSYLNPFPIGRASTVFRSFTTSGSCLQVVTLVSIKSLGSGKRIMTALVLWGGLAPQRPAFTGLWE